MCKFYYRVLPSHIDGLCMVAPSSNVVLVVLKSVAATIFPGCEEPHLEDIS